MIISPSQTSMHLLHPPFRINQHNEKGWESIAIQITIRFLFEQNKNNRIEGFS